MDAADTASLTMPRHKLAPHPETHAGRVYDALVAAALRRAPCPTTSALMSLSGLKSEARVGGVLGRLAVRRCLRMEYPPGVSSMARGMAAVRRCVILIDGHAVATTSWYRPSAPDLAARAAAPRKAPDAPEAPAIDLPPTPSDPHEALGLALRGRRYGRSPVQIDPGALAHRRVANPARRIDPEQAVAHSP